eukprot:9505435-Ditylum_brightwellii.AAC.1
MKPNITTRGWELPVQFKNERLEWVKLKDLKAVNLVELAKYAVVNCLADKSTFKWWVPHVIRKRNWTINKLDRETGTDYRSCAINKEMIRVKVAWIAREGCNPDSMRKGKVSEMSRYQEIGRHLIFNVKMDFPMKACFVAGRDTTEALTAMTYSSVVSRESIRLAFLIAGLNDLDVMFCN